MKGKFFMGKTSSVNVATPAFAGGSISVNGKNKATISKQGNMVNSNYNMDEFEQSIYDYAQKNLAQNLPNLNVFDNDTKKDIKAQVEGYKQKAKQSLNEMYQPMLKNLTNNVASRFGNTDNSAFLEGLNSLENYRAGALASIAQDTQAKQSELYKNELSNRYNYINLLNSLIGGANSNALNYLSSALSNSNAGNSYNSTLFNQNLTNAMNTAKTNNDNMANLQAAMAVIAMLMA